MTSYGLLQPPQPSFWLPVLALNAITMVTEKTEQEKHETDRWMSVRRQSIKLGALRLLESKIFLFFLCGSRKF